MGVFAHDVRTINTKRGKERCPPETMLDDPEKAAAVTGQHRSFKEVGGSFELYVPNVDHSSKENITKVLGTMGLNNIDNLIKGEKKLEVSKIVQQLRLGIRASGIDFKAVTTAYISKGMCCRKPKPEMEKVKTRMTNKKRFLMRQHNLDMSELDNLIS